MHASEHTHEYGLPKCAVHPPVKYIPCRQVRRVAVPERILGVKSTSGGPTRRCRDRDHRALALRAQRAAAHRGPAPITPPGADEQPAARYDGAPERDQYDEDYDYYWGDWRVPLWIALIRQVPWRQRLDIFVIGFIVGLVIAGVAVSWGLLLSRY